MIVIDTVGGEVDTYGPTTLSCAGTRPVGDERHDHVEANRKRASAASAVVRR
jgi:hypothetical protein